VEPKNILVFELFSNVRLVICNQIKKSDSNIGFFFTNVKYYLKYFLTGRLLHYWIIELMDLKREQYSGILRKM